MKQSKKQLVKNTEMIDYEMKARNMFPPDELYPTAEQAKQDLDKSDKKIKKQINKKKVKLKLNHFRSLN